MELVDETDLGNGPDNRKERHHEESTPARLEGEEAGHRAGQQRQVHGGQVPCGAALCRGRGGLRQGAGEVVARDEAADAQQDRRPAGRRARAATPPPVQGGVRRAEDDTRAAEGERHPPAGLEDELTTDLEEERRAGDRVRRVVQHIVRRVPAVAHRSQDRRGDVHRARLLQPD